jgi:hypothetical protein
MRLATVLLTIGLSLGLSGCWFGKKTHGHAAASRCRSPSRLRR